MLIGTSSNSNGIVVTCPLSSAMLKSFGIDNISIAVTSLFPYLAVRIVAANRGSFIEISGYLGYNFRSFSLFIDTLARMMVFILSMILSLSV